MLIELDQFTWDYDYFRIYKYKFIVEIHKLINKFNFSNTVGNKLIGEKYNKEREEI